MLCKIKGAGLLLTEEWAKNAEVAWKNIQTQFDVNVVKQMSGGRIIR